MAEIALKPAEYSAGVPRPAKGRPAGAILENVAGWSLATPALVLIWLMFLGPALVVIGLSFTDWQFGMPTVAWIGLDNYVELFADRVFWISLTNTLIYVGVLVPLSVGLGLGVALLIEDGLSGSRFYSAIYFLPVTATMLATALAWEFAFHPSVGFINQIFSFLGLPTTDWLKNPDTALFALVAIGVWQSMGLNMVLFLAGLRAIPKDLYEAAAIDGADSFFERFRRVTWPMLGPALVFVVTVTAIRSFQVFDTVAVLTDGGPNKATSVLIYQMYQEGFSFLRSAYAAAITVVFLAFTLVLTLAQATLLDRRTHYS
ncbi:carbohydrate ABC transporter permease [Microvirga roseola]|uniref:carbohydrate ABC transporter permease n=1 Tax=Microvirga roseola TaxID=2883126 RepID=UPI001E5C6B08|nr:sugar ABC transporter permease [Microvirga roseola]